MSRGIGEFELIHGAIPEWAAILIALLTQLGDVWFLALLFVVLFWFEVGDREELAELAGVSLAGIGLYLGLKHVLELPRPDRPLIDLGNLPAHVVPIYEVTGTATGYGFPSGHAVTATIVYVGLAGVLTIGTRRQRYAAAAAIVTAVCFSRVALGVHYVVDVVAGAALGLAFLAGARAILGRWPSRRVPLAFALAVGFGGFYLVASGVRWEPVVLVAASVVGFLGSRRVPSR